MFRLVFLFWKILRDQKPKDVEAVLALGQKWEQIAYEDIENKRMKYINKLSLAERLGLV